METNDLESAARPNRAKPSPPMSIWRRCAASRGRCASPAKSRASARRCRRRDSASRSRATPPSPSSIRTCFRAGATAAPKSLSSRRSPTRRRRRIAISAGCPAAIPNLHAGRIAGAANFLEGLRRFAARRPVHGECGGYMALGAALTDASGAVHRMAGLLGVETSFAKRKMNLGYRDATLDRRPAASAPRAKAQGSRVSLFNLADDRRRRMFRICRRRLRRRADAVGIAAGQASGSFFHIIAEAA